MLLKAQAVEHLTEITQTLTYFQVLMLFPKFKAALSACCASILQDAIKCLALLTVGKHTLGDLNGRVRRLHFYERGGGGGGLSSRGCFGFTISSRLYFKWLCLFGSN